VPFVLLFSAPAIASDPDKKTSIVKIDKSSFRVTLVGDTVIVANKAMIAGRTMKVRDQMRRAVIEATGCELTDELWFDATLKGRLLCTEQK
jgi:hypothetical protein